MTDKKIDILSFPEKGTYIGRAWFPQGWKSDIAGPHIIVVKNGHVFDVTRDGPTCSALLERPDHADVINRALSKRPLISLSLLLENGQACNLDPSKPYLLAPIDIQCIKAAGVTFVSSMLERVIEERAGGDPSQSKIARGEFLTKLGQDISKIIPGSDEAEQLKKILIAEGAWSQYLEVGIGPYAEIFTKAPIMSAVGFGSEIGIHPESVWNNPEPEVVLVLNSKSQIMGVTLGNDVNLRDFEGRSALLLGKAKDNNASCSIGPLIRLLDDDFTIDNIRSLEVALSIKGNDGFELKDGSSMREISRDILELVQHAAGDNHQYPDGFVLFTGTLFSPTKDRGAVGMGFTHKIGDVVCISSPEIGTLTNVVNTSAAAPPWEFGVTALYKNLAARALLDM